VVFGEDELAAGQVKIKFMQVRDRESETVARTDLVARLRSLLAEDGIQGSLYD
jgi:predicted subunit of tRNA(5-methylaminomethyl-2-thiouridylate) methyltransferase